MKKELEKTYNPADIEDRLYAKWVNKKYFHAEVNANKKHLSQPKSPTNLDFLSKFSYDIERNVVQERSTQVALTEKEIHWL